VFDRTNLYYELTWLDIPMHIMGGFGVASLVLAVTSYKQKKANLLTVLVLYAFIAIGWELYEFAGDVLSQSAWNGWSDTISDFINGGIGAGIAYYLFKK
jgi:ABC-type phosphate/phosphonate transport system permease subunit